jgi:hypothetical protein
VVTQRTKQVLLRHFHLHDKSSLSAFGGLSC